MKVAFTSDDFRSLFCIEYSKFVELYDSKDESYLMEKWTSFTKNLAGFICNLDSKHQARLLEMARRYQ